MSATAALIQAAIEETKIGGDLEKGKVLALLALASAIAEKTGDK